MRGIDDAINACPTVQFHTSHLSPAILVESERHIFLGILAAEEIQLANMILLMLADRIER